MKRSLFILAFSIAFYSTKAQVNSLMSQGNYLYEHMMYASAINYYESVLETSPSQTEAKTKLADCYKRINDSKNAERLYEDLAQSDSTNATYVLNYAEALTKNGKYKKAQQWYGKYATLTGNDARGQKFEATLKEINKLYADSTKYQINYLSINSNEPDFSPVLYKRGLVFCSGRNKNRLTVQDNSPFLDLYYIEDTASIVALTNKTGIRTDDYTPKFYTGDEKEKKSSVYQNMHSDETIVTSNDTKTLGYRTGVNLKDTANNTSQTEVKHFFNVNSKRHEGPFCFSKSQDTMYFTRNNTKKSKDGTTKLTIFTTVMKDGKWSKPQPFQYNDREFSTGHPALTADGKTLFFASDRPGGVGGIDIWYCKWEDFHWGEPINAGTAINTKGNEMFPTVDHTGNLYFASNGLGGLGGFDIFKCLKNSNGTFGNPHNMGYPMNSMKDDFGLQMIGSGHGFFSSNRKNGGHDDDIYHVSVLHKDPLWAKGIVTEVSNDQPIGNAYIFLKDAKQKEWLDTSITAITLHDGTFYIEGLLDYDKEYSVMATADYHDSSTVTISTFKHEEGDTLFVKLQLRQVKPSIALTGTILTSDTKEPMANMKVVLYDTKREKITEYITAADGKYAFALDTNDQYTISCVKPNCGYNYERISTYNVKHSKAYRINMDMVCKGDVIVMNDIFYDYNSVEIRQDAASELDKMAPLFFKYPDMQVELSSHADCRGGKEYNQKLTTERAKSAVAYLITRDIHPSRMAAVGFGEQKPVVKCACDDNKYKKICTEEEFQRNRRTEFKIVRIGDKKPEVSSLAPKQ